MLELPHLALLVVGAVLAGLFLGAMMACMERRVPPHHERGTLWLWWVVDESWAPPTRERSAEEAYWRRRARSAAQLAYERWQKETGAAGGAVRIALAHFDGDRFVNRVYACGPNGVEEVDRG